MVGAILFIILGLMILVFGSRLALFGAGVGALLGIGILSILPGSQSSWLWLIIPIGLAILFAIGAGIAKGFIGLISLALGALAGGAITLALLNLFGISWGIGNWLASLAGAVIGAGIMSNFKDWAMIILAGLVGALLCTRGLQMMIPALGGLIGSLIGLVLAVAGIAYQGGLFGKQKKV